LSGRGNGRGNGPRPVTAGRRAQHRAQGRHPALGLFQGIAAAITGKGETYSKEQCGQKPCDQERGKDLEVQDVGAFGSQKGDGKGSGCPAHTRPRGVDHGITGPAWPGRHSPVEENPVQHGGSVGFSPSAHKWLANSAALAGPGGQRTRI